jgi:hypothetical protein
MDSNQWIEQGKEIREKETKEYLNSRVKHLQVIKTQNEIKNISKLFGKGLALF